MKIALLCLLFIVAIVHGAPNGYTTKYDNINIDEILHHDRLLKRYHECLMDRAPCTPDAATLKDVLPDAIKTRCEKCNERQKDGARKIMKFLSENKKEMFEELLAKYDPDGTFRKQYEKDAKEYGIEIKQDKQ